MSLNEIAHALPFHRSPRKVDHYLGVSKDGNATIALIDNEAAENVTFDFADYIQHATPEALEDFAAHIAGLASGEIDPGAFTINTNKSSGVTIVRNPNPEPKAPNT
jgi:hypothetical protein